jgi:hypothetical protein
MNENKEIIARALEIAITLIEPEKSKRHMDLNGNYYSYYLFQKF